MEELPFEIHPRDVKARLESGEPLRLIDVREPEEFVRARIDGSRLIPMRTVPARLPELEDLAGDATLVVLCHHGVRSAQVVGWLRRQGIEAAQSLQGGIERWSLEVDPAVPRY